MNPWRPYMPMQPYMAGFPYTDFAPFPMGAISPDDPMGLIGFMGTNASGGHGCPWITQAQ
jgi:hypothetical protein